MAKRMNWNQINRERLIQAREGEERERRLREIAAASQKSTANRHSKMRWQILSLLGLPDHAILDDILLELANRIVDLETKLNSFISDELDAEP